MSDKAKFPIELSAEILETCDLWAKDDRLWTTQETVAFNLRTFARKVIHLAAESQRTQAPSTDSMKVEQLEFALKNLNSDLCHAVSCMNRSCRQCNEMQRRFGPAQEGGEGLLQAGTQAQAAQPELIQKIESKRALFCQGCLRKKPLVRPTSSSSIVGGAGIHTPEGWVCVTDLILETLGAPVGVLEGKP